MRITDLIIQREAARKAGEQWLADNLQDEIVKADNEQQRQQLLASTNADFRHYPTLLSH